MPQTGMEKIVFLAMMALAMTAAMETYNLLLQGASPEALFWALVVDLPLMWVVVMAVQHFIAAPLVRQLIRRLAVPPGMLFLCVPVLTVLVMCPLMSFAATLIFKFDPARLGEVWLATFLVNLPMAMLWQLFVAGPAVRKAFRLLFRRANA